MISGTIYKYLKAYMGTALKENINELVRYMNKRKKVSIGALWSCCSVQHELDQIQLCHTVS